VTDLAVAEPCGLGTIVMKGLWFDGLSVMRSQCVELLKASEVWNISPSLGRDGADAGGCSVHSISRGLANHKQTLLFGLCRARAHISGSRHPTLCDFLYC
jgi:hypothetical protein